MDFFEVVSKRYSERNGFTGEPIGEKDIKKIVSAGIMAPSGCNLQTTEFIVIIDKGLINEIAEIIEKDYVKTASLIIVLIVDKDKSLDRGEIKMNFYIEDASAACENILLAVTALGYASCWIDGRLRVNNIAQRIGKLLKVPSAREVRIILPIGKPVKEGQPNKKKAFEERVYFNYYE